MKWNSFNTKFHISWHKDIKPFVESKACDKIYQYLKDNKDSVIWPASINTFRNFKNSNLKNTVCAVIFREPYSDIEPDGHPLSGFVANKYHIMIDMWHDAMEREFYELNLNTIKDSNLDFILKQGVFMHNADLTVFKGKPGSHKDLWKEFTSHVIKILRKRSIPIMFIGQDVKDTYSHLLKEDYPVFCVKKSLHDIKIEWKSEGEFIKLNDHIREKTKYNEIMWVDIELPF